MLKTFPLFLSANIFRTILILAAFTLLPAPPTARADMAVQWVQTGPGTNSPLPAGLKVDGSGNIVVVSSFYNPDGTYDFYAAKFAQADGARLWERRYNGPANGDDKVAGVALDGGGNVFVTAASTGLTGYTEFYTAKYAAADGNLLWEKRYSGLANPTPIKAKAQPKAIAMDAAGNVIVTGSVIGASNNHDFYTVKYAGADGTVLWEVKYTGPPSANDEDNPVAVAVDAHGDVVVTGASTGSGPVVNNLSPDYYTAKYAGTNGALIWEKRFAGTYDGFSNTYDAPTALALAPNGDVVVTGFTESQPGPLGLGANEDFYTIKYAAVDGAVLWEKKYSPPALFRDIPSAVAVDSGGNVIVTGYTSTANFNSYFQRIVTVKFAAGTGAVLWDKIYPGSSSPLDVGTDVAIDASDNVIVTGSTFFGGNPFIGDFYTAKYAAVNGALLLEKRYNPLIFLDEEASKVGLTPDGGIVVLGFSDPAGLTVVKYRPIVGAEPATLTTPATGSAYAATIALKYVLPNTAVNGTVKLAFAGATSTVLTLVSTDGTVGVHSFNLPSANLNVLGHVAALSGPAALADGIYSVTLSYQDTAGDPVASTINSNVRIDRVAPALTAVTIASNGGNPAYAKVGSVIAVTVTANEAILAPTATILGLTITLTNVGGNTWQATRTVPGGVAQETATFSISVKDLAGNVLAPVTATTDGSSVTVDRVAPTLTLLGANPQSVEGGTVYVDPGATASDATAGNLNGAIQVTGALNMNVVGTYTRTYTVADFAGNTATKSRTVRVVDTTPAVITILGDNPAIVGVGIQYLDPGATASDTVAGNLTARIQTSSNVNANVIGVYAVTYTVSDGFNIASATRTVRIIAMPIAGTDTLGTVENTPVTAPAAKLLANDADPGGNPLSVTGVSPTSSQAGTVVLNGGLLTYTPPPGFTGSDSFTYTIANGFGGTAIGIVGVTVSRADGSSLNVVSLERTLDGFLVRFAGIPGDAYLIQFTDSLAPPVTWQTLTPPGQIQAGPNGLFQFEDKPNPIPPQRFYRAAIPQ